MGSASGPRRISLGDVKSSQCEAKGMGCPREITFELNAKLFGSFLDF